jgi:hypothetical protein
VVVRFVESLIVWVDRVKIFIKGCSISNCENLFVSSWNKTTYENVRILNIITFQPQVFMKLLVENHNRFITIHILTVKTFMNAAELDVSSLNRS